jgi:hypothetical protein
MTGFVGRARALALAAVLTCGLAGAAFAQKAPAAPQGGKTPAAPTTPATPPAAQPPAATPAAPPPTPAPPPAAAAPAGPPVPVTLEWLAGRWGERCDQTLVELGADFIAEVRRGQSAPNFRAAASYALANDVVLISVGALSITGSEAPSPGTVVLLRRIGDQLRLLTIDDPARPERRPRVQTVQRCP